MPRRFLALHLPRLATDRLRRAGPALRDDDRPLATWVQSGPRRLLAAVDAAAEAAGLWPGQALADAQALLPDLLLRPAAPAEDAAALAALALWARRYTPLAAADPPDGLLLDITGCAHLLGGEAALLRDALARLRRAGFAACGAVADAAATAGALARAQGGDPVLAAGDPRAAALLAGLPIGLALRLPEAMRVELARLGLCRLRDLLDQPRAPLARRFGQELLDRLDAVSGQRRVVLQPAIPPPALDVARDLLEPILTRAGIDAVLDRLLEALRDRLQAAGLGARRLALLAWRMDGTVQEVAIGTGQPARDPAHLRRLFAERLETLAPGLGFERMALEVRETERMPAGRQAGMGIGGGEAEAATRAEALSRLLDGLVQRRLRVHRVVPLASHWPERMVAALAPHAALPEMPKGWPMGGGMPGLPVLLLRRPERLEAVVALLPDDPPLLLRRRGEGAAQRLRAAEGPLRLEPEWWRAAGAEAPRRDYYRVTLASGARLWICRSGPPEAARWWLHGHLP